MRGRVVAPWAYGSRFSVQGDEGPGRPGGEVPPAMQFLLTGHAGVRDMFIQRFCVALLW